MDCNKEVSFVSAVVYCYNDAQNIGCFIENLDKTLADNFLKYEIIVVNDASTDESVRVIKEYAARKCGKVISILNMSHTQGLEAAMNAGVDLAIGDFVFEFDNAFADFEWPLVMDVFRHSLTGYDIVSARPNRYHSVSSKLFYAIFNRYANLQYEIATESFRVLSRRAINRVRSVTECIPYRKAAYANCGLAMDFMHYFPNSKKRNGKRTDRQKLAINSLILHTDIAYHITVSLAALMVLITIAFGIYALFTKIYAHPVEGWTTTILFISLGFAGLFTILSMILKYLQLILSLVFQKKNYLFESIDKIQ